jgi:hypothetical protein
MEEVMDNFARCEVENERQSGAFRADRRPPFNHQFGTPQENRNQKLIVDWQFPKGLRCIETLSVDGHRGRRGRIA